MGFYSLHTCPICKNKITPLQRVKFFKANACPQCKSTLIRNREWWLQGLIGWIMVMTSIPYFNTLKTNPIILGLETTNLLFCILYFIIGCSLGIIGLMLMLVFMYRQKYIILQSCHDTLKDKLAETNT